MFMFSNRTSPFFHLYIIKTYMNRFGESLKKMNSTKRFPPPDQTLQSNAHGEAAHVAVVLAE